MSWPARIAAALALVLAVLAVGWRVHVKADAAGYARAQATFTSAIQQQQIDAANTLAAEIKKTLSAEQALATAKNNQELTDAKHQKTIDDYSHRLRNLAGPAGRLRDPHAAAAECRPCSVKPQDPATAPAQPGAADPAQAGGLLSAELSGLLRRLTREADDINAAYASCRADAYTLRTLTD